MILDPIAAASPPCDPPARTPRYGEPRAIRSGALAHENWQK